jgi:hypothetical protein
MEKEMDIKVKCLNPLMVDCPYSPEPSIKYCEFCSFIYFVKKKGKEK